MKVQNNGVEMSFVSHFYDWNGDMPIYENLDQLITYYQF